MDKTLNNVIEIKKNCKQFDDKKEKFVTLHRVFHGIRLLRLRKDWLS